MLIYLAKQKTVDSFFSIPPFPTSGNHQSIFCINELAFHLVACLFIRFFLCLTLYLEKNPQSFSLLLQVVIYIYIFLMPEKLLYTFKYQWTLKLFPYLGYCK